MNENSVKFVDTSKECIDLMKKYAKEGLKASGKVITKILKNDIKSNHYKTGQPYMEVGYRSRAQMKKRGVKYYVNPWWFETGIKPHTIATKQFVDTGKTSYELHDNRGVKFGIIVRHPGRTGKNLLRNTVYNNVKEIRQAQIESLKKIDDIKVEKGLFIDLGGDEEID